MKIYVNVTKEDVKKGMAFKWTGDRCPIGRAMNRALQNNGIKDKINLDWCGGYWDSDDVLHMVPALKGMSMFGCGDDFISKPRKFTFEYQV